jgi:hypothetical protein
MTHIFDEQTKIIDLDLVDGRIPVDGSEVTQPISAATLPLPTGASQDGTDITTPTAMPTGGVGIRGWLSAIWTKINTSISVTGTFWQTTQPVSISSMPSTPVTGSVSVSNMIAAVETGLATSAKQLADNHQVTVSNIANTSLITGFSTSTNQGKFNGAVSGLATWKEADGKPRISSMPYTYDIAEGNITGHVAFSKFGRVSGVNNLLVDVWPGEGASASIYVFPTVAQQMNVVSTSANDDNSNTGINKLMILGLDANYAEITEEVTLDGTNAVTTAASFLRINGCYSTLVGTASGAVGTITIKNTSGTPNTITYGGISIGLTACRQMIYTVPAGKTLYVTSLVVGSGAGGNALKLNVTIFTPKYKLFGSTTFLPTGETLSINSETVRDLEMPAVIPAKTDVKVSVQGDYASGGTTCISAIRGWIE